jgi:hypothetical protein
MRPILSARQRVLLGLLIAMSGCRSKRVPEPAFTLAPPAPSAPIPTAAPLPEPASSATPASAKAAVAAKTGDLPKETPRFAWGGPLSARVDEHVEQQGRAVRFAYSLDACPGDQRTTLVTHRNMRIIELGGVPVGANPPKEIRELEAASSALPTMVIDAHGDFARATGYADTFKRLAESYPGEDFSALRHAIDNGRAASLLETGLSTLWEGWVGAWLRFDPSRGASQDVSTAEGAAGATRATLVFDGFTSDHHAELHSRFVPSRAEMDQLAQNFSAEGLPADALRAVEIKTSVETDWPDIRPYHARTERHMIVRDQGKDVAANEVHDYKFVWGSADAQAPSCP